MSRDITPTFINRCGFVTDCNILELSPVFTTSLFVLLIFYFISRLNAKQNKKSIKETKNAPFHTRSEKKLKSTQRPLPRYSTKQLVKVQRKAGTKHLKQN